MKAPLWLCATALVTLAHTGAFAQSNAAPKPPAASPAAAAESMSAVLNASGLYRALELSSGTYEALVKAQVPADADEAAVANMSQMIKDNLAAPSLARQITRRGSATLSKGEIKQILAWYATPLGKKIAALNVEATTLTQNQVAMHKQADIQRARYSAERRSLIDQLVTATREENLMTDVAVNVASTSVRQMAEAKQMPPEMLSFFLSAVNDRREMFRSEFRRIAVARQSVLLANFTDEEVRQMIGFQRTPASRKLDEVVIRGTEDAVQNTLRLYHETTKGRPGPRVGHAPQVPNAVMAGAGISWHLRDARAL